MTESLAAVSTRRAIAVRNRIENLAGIYQLLESAAADASLPDTLLHTLLLVSEELFSNIVGYGYPSAREDIILFSVECRPEAIVLRLVDHAIAFDISKDPKEPSGRPLDEMEPGGLGLFLVHHFAKSLHYRRDGDANTTEIVIAREPGAA